MHFIFPARKGEGLPPLRPWKKKGSLLRCPPDTTCKEGEMKIILFYNSRLKKEQLVLRHLKEVSFPSEKPPNYISSCRWGKKGPLLGRKGEWKTPTYVGAFLPECPLSPEKAISDSEGNDLSFFLQKGRTRERQKGEGHGIFSGRQKEINF